MNLEQALNLIAAQTHCDHEALQAYAAEDTLLGGYHWNGALATFPAGSIWGVEGQVLYTLVRHLKPDKVVEIGSWGGCSAAHLALAVKANGKGHVCSVDNASETSFEPGYLLPGELKPYVTLIRANGQDYLKEQDDGSIGLLFEDANHTTVLVKELVELGLKKCEAGGIIVNHDAARQFAYDGSGRIASASDLGQKIRDGIAQANAYFRPYLVDPSDCGFSITVVPGVRVDKHSQKVDASPVSELPIASDHLAALSIGNANIESVSKPPAPKSYNMDMKLLAPLPPGLRGEKKPRTRKK